MLPKAADVFFRNSEQAWREPVALTHLPTVFCRDEFSVYDLDSDDSEADSLDGTIA